MYPRKSSGKSWIPLFRKICWKYGMVPKRSKKAGRYKAFILGEFLLKIINSIVENWQALSFTKYVVGKGDFFMKVKVKLEAIIEEMELAFEESRSLLNTKTGEIVLLTSDDLNAAEDEEPFEHLPEWQQENRMMAMEVVENYDDYLELPTKYDVNEYDIMENFCFTVRTNESRIAY